MLEDLLAIPRKNFDLGPMPDTSLETLGRELFPVDFPELQAVIDVVNKTVEAHGKYTVRETGNGSLSEACRAALRRLNPAPACLFLLGTLYTGRLYPTKNDYILMTKDSVHTTLDAAPWFKYPDQLRTRMEEYLLETRNDERCYDTLFSTLDDLAPPEQRYALARKIVLTVISAAASDDRAKQRLPERFLLLWLSYLKQCAIADSDWQDYFFLAGKARRLFKETELSPEILEGCDYIRAIAAGVLTEEEGMIAFLESGLTDPITRATLLSDKPSFAAALKRYAEAVAEAVCRDDVGAEDRIAIIAGAIRYLEGTNHFVNLLAALACEALNESPLRLYSTGDMNWVRSHMLRACHPAPGENEQTLATCLEGKNISSERLRDAAFFAPQWQAMVDRYLGQETPADPTLPDVDTRGMNLRDIADRADHQTGLLRKSALVILSRIGWLYYNSWRDPAWYGEKEDAYFLELLGWRNGMAISDVFHPGSEAYRAIAVLVGERNAALAKAMWDNTADYLPRYRDPAFGCLHIPGNIGRLNAFLSALVDGFSMTSFLSEQVKGAPSRPYGLITAKRRIYRGQTKFADRLLAVLIDEAGEGGMFNRTKETLEARMRLGKGLPSISALVSAMLKCGRPDAWEYIAGLQPDAALPESYRTDILNQANRGQYDAFVKIIEINKSDYHFRWSATQAACRWSGIESGLVDRVFWAERGLELFETFLQDESAARRSLTVGDAQLAYVGLWSLSQRGVDIALEAFDQMRDGGVPDDIMLSGLHWLGKVGNMTLRIRHVMPILENRENWKDELKMTLVLHCLGIKSKAVDFGWRYPYMLADRPGENHPGMASSLFVTEKELLNIRTLLKEYLNTLPGDANRCHGGRLEQPYGSIDFVYFKHDIEALIVALDKK